MTDQDSVVRELSQGRCVVIQTRGASMRPLLWQGRTQVLIRPANQPLRVGDLPLVLVRPGLLRLHRIIEVRPSLLLTRGDNSSCIEQVEPQAVMGVASRIFWGRHSLSLESLPCRLYGKLWLSTAWLRLPLFRVRSLFLSLIRKKAPNR